MTITTVFDELIARPGDQVTVDKATTTVTAVGVTVHGDGRLTPIVRLADGRRITGEAAYYVV